MSSAKFAFEMLVLVLSRKGLLSDDEINAMRADLKHFHSLEQVLEIIGKHVKDEKEESQ